MSYFWQNAHGDMIMHNIESKKLMPHHDYRVGYTCTGQAVRIYGSSGNYRMHGYCFDTLKKASKFLETYDENEVAK